MIQISLCSVLWAAVSCDMFILLLHRLKKHVDIRAFVPLYAAVMVRMVMPLDSVRMAVISDRWVYPELYLPLIEKRDWLGGKSVVPVLCTIWAAMACALAVRYGIIYLGAVRRLQKDAVPAGGGTLVLFDRIAGKKPLSISVCVTPYIGTPYGIGVFHRRMLLPAFPYSEEALSCILRHEYMHFRNHDVLFKQIIILFCMVFWWNPAVWLMKRDVEQLIELRCDAAATKGMSHAEKIGYLEAIVDVVRGQSVSDNTPYAMTRLSAADCLEERFHIVMREDSGNAHPVRNRIFLCGFALLFVLSYTVILQPSREPPENTEEGVVEYSPEDSYIIHSKDGAFWLYRANCLPVKIEMSEAYFHQEIGFIIVEEK